MKRLRRILDIILLILMIAATALWILLMLKVW